MHKDLFQWHLEVRLQTTTNEILLISVDVPSPVFGLSLLGHRTNMAWKTTHKCKRLVLKPETRRANRWPSEAFGETSGTNLFGVFSCVGAQLRTLAVGRLSHQIL